MSSSRPVFVLTTAKDCPACHSFKKRIRDDMINKIRNQGKVEIVTIDLESTRSKPDPNKYHKDYQRFIGWYPTMALFPADRWHNHSSELIGVIKNGKIVPPGKDENGKFKPEHIDPVGKIDLSADDVVKWIDYTLSKHAIFTKNQRGNKNRAQPIPSQQPQNYTPPPPAPVHANNYPQTAPSRQQPPVKYYNSLGFKPSRVK